ncbi:hypothetical protein [Chitinophaga sp. HK235]|uniref:hypothetical protein n=1 Tax=Chitinophaga sp. HK235 TaxID=2952571 RepID=UPI001BAA0351|nr:hypothetical protein [Chitinophaga sp. HK235]
MKKVKLLSVVAVVALCGAFAAAQADVNAKVYIIDPLRPELGCFVAVNATLQPNLSLITTTFATLDKWGWCPDVYRLYATL